MAMDLNVGFGYRCGADCETSFDPSLDVPLIFIPDIFLPKGNGHDGGTAQLHLVHLSNKE
jgi:hypothetical protein